jgi:hypothetical protein
VVAVTFGSVLRGTTRSVGFAWLSGRVLVVAGLLCFGCATGTASGGEDAGAVEDAGGATEVPDGDVQEQVGRTAVRGVSGGVKASSPNYQLIGTMGESPGATGASESPGYRLEGGVIGTTQAE